MSRSDFAIPFRARSLPFAHNGPTMVQEKPLSQPIPQAPTYTDLRRERLASLILSGPVFKSGGLIISDLPVEEGCSTDTQQTCLDDWLHMGAMLEKALGRQANDVRVYQYYLPIYFWILREVDRHNELVAKSGGTRRPFILGFCCPQGGGKTTMTSFLDILLRTAGKSVQIASLDDFYLTNAEQRQVAKRNPSNRLMQYRGMPGTHDLPLLNDTLDSLRRGEEVSIPKYDKTAFNGRGDRAPKKNWKDVSDSTDIVLFEGWCLGFEPIPEDIITDPDLFVVNKALKDFTSIYKRLDGIFIIEIQNMDWVFDWRLQAERGSRASGRPGLSDEQVKDFVSRFMPAYKHYTPNLYHRSKPLFPNHELHIEIDQMRRPVHRNSDF
ncbi:D-glycerate 3-kinase, chloroplastic [Gracilariopsis chorda]|uniref:D-glycerate 3-kinase, chloroplastic n=1 Tax=Gracilariopsis chorda TaxID=448386 RepID=A0A2V3J673_9FLOR|nr:D-glycerate 3-kinase, chloroplastic [Gracilariopsis chorda]|eukprot:PXF49874.1 D-glycerate 3-kinase, chloroplastic [Gracilariopsis chorda]